VKVAVCGLPRSGNRLLRDLLLHHGHDADVRHFGMSKAFRTGGDQEVAVWPIRAFGYWSRSIERDWDLLPKPHAMGQHYTEAAARELVRIHEERTFERVKALGIGVLRVSYEAIVKDPDTWGPEIVGFVAPGSKWKGWPREVFDGNEKWRGSRRS